MDAVNVGVFRTVELSSRERLKRAAVPHPGEARGTSDTLTEVAQLTAAAPAPQAPMARAIADSVTQVQSYAVTLAPLPSAASAALLQAVSDIEQMARLGQKAAPSLADVRSTASGMLRSGRDRAAASNEPNTRTAVLAIAIGNAARTLSAIGDSAANGLVSHFFDLCNRQQNPLSRSTVLEAGARVLSGVLCTQPQTVKRTVERPMVPSAAFALSPSRKSQFLALWDHFDRAEVRVNRRYEGETFPVQAALAHLLRRGDLDKTDAHGDDLLSNLDQLRTQPLAPGVDRDLVLAQTIAHLHDPGRTMSQGMKMTCAAATVSYQLAKQRPAEYARLVCGLTWTEGQVRLASGTIARRSSDALQEDGSGRSAVERLVQSALMQVGGTPTGGTVYEPLADGFIDNRGQLVQTGMFARQLAGLEEAVGQGRYLTLEKPSPQFIEETVKKAAERIPVTLSWEGAEEHWVLARGIIDGRVYFRNPHGHRETDRMTLSSGDHRLHQGGIESLPLDEFVQRTKTILVPSPAT